jgi:Phage tail protein (Tail_P2_I)
MTAGYPDATERVLALLPAHVRNRDDASGGLLRALIEAVAAELAVLEADLDELYASWFAETCPEWVVPYLADLLGVASLPPDVSDAGVSRRAFVANTVAYRRRKGTPAAAEQVARDATGWPARAVEYYRLLATATHTQHVRLDRPATHNQQVRLERPVTVSLRTLPADGGPLELIPRAAAQGGLDPVAHTAEVRRIASGAGRYGIGNLGVFVFPDLVSQTGWAPPVVAEDGGWAVHSLGYATPLYAPPAAETTIEHLAGEADLPVPLRPRRLLALLAAARVAAASATGPDQLAAIRDALPAGIRIGGQDLDPLRLRVAGLEDLAIDPAGTEPAPLPGWQVAVDAVRGKLFPYRDGAPAAPGEGDGFLARHCYGATAEVGAGCYDRTAVHLDVLAADPYRGDPARGGPGVVAQRLVLGGSSAGPALPGIAAALEAVRADWAEPGGLAGGSYVIAVGDNASYPGDLRVHIPAATRLILVAAGIGDPAQASGRGIFPAGGAYSPAGLRPVVRGSLTVSGEGGSSLIVDGLVIDGDVVADDGELGSLTLSQCTVAGGVRVGRPGGAGNPGVTVRLVRGIASQARFGPGAASLELLDSVVDAAAVPDAAMSPGDVARGPGRVVLESEARRDSRAEAGAGDAVAGAGLALAVTGSTVRGKIIVRTLEASSSILDGLAAAEHRQTGCVRYSYVKPGSAVPRRFRCVPDPAAPQAEKRAEAPVYAATDPGSPHYLALAPYGPADIAAGGEGGSEMGVHHHLYRPVRLAAAARLLEPYVPAGMQLGVVAPLASGNSG